MMCPALPLPLLVVLAFAVSGCVEPTSDGFSLVGDSVPVARIGEVQDDILEYQRTYGIGVLPAAFSYRGPAAVSASGQMLLRPHSDCVFAVLDISTGALRRLAGRCGDGPHESRAIAGAGLYGDTIVFADARSLRLRFVGGADTVARRVRLHASKLPGIRSIHSLALLDDSTAFVTLVASGLPGETSRGELVAFLRLKDGVIQPVPFREPNHRVTAAREADRYYHACTHRDADLIVLENNGPPELLGLGSDGMVRWALRTEVISVDPRSAVEQGSRSAAFQWNRVPVRPACSRDVVFSRVLPARWTDPVRPLGNALVVDYRGRVRLNMPFTAADTALVHATWFTDDSLLYIAASEAMAPRVMSFRLRSRRPGESGVFSLPDSVRLALNTMHQ